MTSQNAPVQDALGGGQQSVVGLDILKLLGQLGQYGSQNELVASELGGVLGPGLSPTGSFMNTLGRDQFEAARQSAERDYRLDVQRFGLDVANFNFQQRATEASQQLQTAGLLASLRGPENAIAYNFALNNQAAPAGQQVNPFGSQINQPFAQDQGVGPTGAPPPPSAGGERDSRTSDPHVNTEGGQPGLPPGFQPQFVTNQFGGQRPPTFEEMLQQAAGQSPAGNPRVDPFAFAPQPPQPPPTGSTGTVNPGASTQPPAFTPPVPDFTGPPQVRAFGPEDPAINPATPANAMPVAPSGKNPPFDPILGYEQGGMAPGRAIVGDSSDGKENQELVVSPSPFYVIPMDQIAGGQGQVPRAQNGGAFPGLSQTVFSPEQIASSPVVQKATGNAPSPAFGATQLNTTLPGTNTQLPFGSQFDFRTYLNALPSERKLLGSVVETPRQQGGLGLSYEDFIEQSRRAAPIGRSFGLSAVGR